MCACGKPFLARDGTLTFPERGARGAAIVTANGLEFRDRLDIPDRVIVRDANEPWRAPIGFILPQSGRFTEASRPTLVATRGLAIVLRPSDTRVPAWGGEVLVRIDVIAPAAEGTARFGENIALVVDGDGEDTLRLAEVALAQLSARDRVVVIDAHGARIIVPKMPPSHRSMVLAAIERRLESRTRGKKDIRAALSLASAAFGEQGATRVLYFGETPGPSAYGEDVRAELTRLMREKAILTAVATSPRSDAAALSALAVVGFGTTVADPDRAARERGVRDAIPPAGLLVFRDVTLTFEGTPAPSHVLEASGGDVTWHLESGELSLGDVHAGEARTEVVRVTVPAWVPGEPFTFRVTAHVSDVELGYAREFVAEMPCAYDDDIERIAQSRSGDVIAYASALATLKRLDAAFVGGFVSRAGGLRSLAQMHATSMALFARDTKDFAALEQAELLRALLAAQ
jgi:hypothetical protein